jgi:hypothetical protein
VMVRRRTRPLASRRKVTSAASTPRHRRSCKARRRFLTLGPIRSTF